MVRKDGPYHRKVQEIWFNLILGFEVWNSPGTHQLGLLVHVPDRGIKKKKKRLFKKGDQINFYRLSAGSMFFSFDVGSSNLPTQPHQSIYEHPLENAKEAFTHSSRMA